MTPRCTLPRPPDLLDARLVAAAVAGNDDAFSELADRYRTVLHAHCRRILGSAPDAEDAVQEALLRAWRRRGAFEGRSSFGWWLLRIATNTCMDIARHGAGRPVVLLRPPDSDDYEGDPPGKDLDTDPAALVTTREAVEHAYLVAIRVLPERQRAVLVLRAVLGFSAADTAELLGDTVPSVNSALQRARTRSTAATAASRRRRPRRRRHQPSRISCAGWSRPTTAPTPQWSSPRSSERRHDGEVERWSCGQTRAEAE